MRCAIWYHLHNLEKREQHPWRSVTFSKVALFHGYFSRFLNCTNSTKSSWKTLHILYIIYKFYIQYIYIYYVCVCVCVHSFGWIVCEKTILKYFLRTHRFRQRGVFRTQSNIHDGTFFAKLATHHRCSPGFQTRLWYK